MLIYHIVTPERWEQFKNEPFYEAESLATERFIHCSYFHQLPQVLERYYKDVERVLILTINPNQLTSELIAEASTGGEIYPHIYGAINNCAIVETQERTL
ncbi:MAG: DUF952 domain-containing protein [Pyrinomonadaceae bacterium]